MLVDGIDEDTSLKQERPCILSLLPNKLIDNLVVILSTRPDPPFPAEPLLSASHPVRESVVYTLEQANIVKTYERRALNELKKLIDSNDRLPLQSIEFLAISKGYLTVNDLAELASETPINILSVFENTSGRTFLSKEIGATPFDTMRNKGYRFGHAELHAQAMLCINEDRLEEIQSKINKWCDKYNKKGN